MTNGFALIYYHAFFVDNCYFLLKYLFILWESASTDYYYKYMFSLLY